MEIAEDIKRAATAAFVQNDKLAAMTPPAREAAAQFYEQIAAQTVGARAGIARLYNLERARFLRGEVSRIAPSAPLFAKERGLL